MTGWLAAGADADLMCIDKTSYREPGNAPDPKASRTCLSNARRPGVLVYQLTDIRKDCASRFYCSKPLILN